MDAITRSLAFTHVALLTLGGCAKDSSKWVGTWRGERQGMVLKELENTPMGESLRLIEIKILPTGRYEMTEAGVPTVGEVKFGQDRVFLKPMARFDRALDVVTPDLTLELQPEGTALYYDPAGGHPQPAELKKVEETPASPQP